MNADSPQHGSRERPTAAGGERARAALRRAWPSLQAWTAIAALLPVPTWFLWHALRDPGPAWRATYFSDRTFSGSSFTAQQRELSFYWDAQHRHTPGGFDAQSSSARYATCLSLPASREIPFMLVANGNASFALNGTVELSGADEDERWVRAKVIRLSAGTHHLSVEFSARNWPSIGLLASLDGRAPQAVGSGSLHQGVSTELPLDGDSGPCTGR